MNRWAYLSQDRERVEPSFDERASNIVIRASLNREWTHRGNERENLAEPQDLHVESMCSHHAWMPKGPERAGLIREHPANRKMDYGAQLSSSKKTKRGNFEVSRDSSSIDSSSTSIDEESFASERGWSESMETESSSTCSALDIRPKKILLEADVIAIFLAGKLQEGTSIVTMQNRGQILALSREYHVTPKTIRDIWNRRTWRSVTSRLINAAFSDNAKVSRR
jgi:hypothetical protein